MSKSFFIVLLSYLLASDHFPPAETKSHPQFPYHLEQPNAIFEMPEALKEISGLSFTADMGKLAAVNDEEGIVFLLDKKTGDITDEIKFWDEGDYEGLEIVGDHAYIIKSSGTIYQVKHFLTDSASTSKVKSFLNKENDVEGLAYDSSRHSLLVGCKGKIAEGEDEEDAFKKAIYEFDLDMMVMQNEPVFLLTLPNIKEYLSHMEEHSEMERLLEEFEEDEDELRFSPSGIAIHPLTRHVYVTSSKGKLLLVLDTNGGIVHLKKLEKKVHRQPEGICFDKDGTLYIANEGKDDKAVIYKFLYRN